MVSRLKDYNVKNGIGSAIIKKVLPALPDLSYKNFNIKEGGSLEGKVKATMYALFEYFKLGRLAMVETFKSTS